MPAGKRDRRVTIQQATITYDALNNPVQTWSNLTTVWAERMDLSDRELVMAKEVGAEMTTRFRIKWSDKVSDMSPKDRLVCEGNTYETTNVKEIGRREGIEITAVFRTD